MKEQLTELIADWLMEDDGIPKLVEQIEVLCAADASRYRFIRKHCISGVTFSNDGIHGVQITVPSVRLSQFTKSKANQLDLIIDHNMKLPDNPTTKEVSDTELLIATARLALATHDWLNRSSSYAMTTSTLETRNYLAHLLTRMQSK